MVLLCPKYMKRSNQPTAYILIKANTQAEYDMINYAIIHIDTKWQTLIRKRLNCIEQFCEDSAFRCFSYWDAPVGYYYITDQQIYEQDLMPLHEDQVFVTLDPDELDLLELPENRLEAQQLLITRGGIAHFSAYASGSGEEYWTEKFNLNRLIKS